MPTQDGIAKLAREYVEQSAEEVGTKLDPESWAFDCMITQAKDVINFLLRTHCIVSKEKVRKAYDNVNQSDVYDRFDNGYNLGVVEILESLFDAEIFKDSEV